MTQIRKVPLSQGVQWLVQAVNIGARNPRAVFGAALLFIATLYTLALLFVLPFAAGIRDAATGAPDPARMLTTMVPLFLMLVFVLPILLGGLMHVIREAEAGRPVRARDLFAPFRLRKAGPLAMLGVIQIVLAALSILLVVVLAGDDYWTDYMTAMRTVMSGGTPVMPEPNHPGLMMAVQLLFNYFTYTLLLLCIPLILFSGTGLVDAVKASLRASVSNVAANLLAGGLFMAGTLVAALIVGILGLLAALIGSLIHPLLGALLSVVLYAGFGAAILVVLVGGSYLAWRDTFGDEDAPTAKPVPQASNGHIEA
ncbi:hypothetical protein ASE35_15370 [Lysobacter sp. Root916]|uniref:hypothetical protein n=1 Tax=Lysobacter sp. Root916 TaxID=1736606 RepID=UPI0007110C57|nr:hypothetical protein [Lysobacter sp. Root916]KRD31382.1 hypothetical protein ASE35_15370 [Lysobacter sp. Root916]